jgi:hypothetical protein
MSFLRRGAPRGLRLEGELTLPIVKDVDVGSGEIWSRRKVYQVRLKSETRVCEIVVVLCERGRERRDFSGDDQQDPYLNKKKSGGLTGILEVWNLLVGS